VETNTKKEKENFRSLQVLTDFAKIYIGTSLPLPSPNFVWQATTNAQPQCLTPCGKLNALWEKEEVIILITPRETQTEAGTEGNLTLPNKKKKFF
jgi:hypothetical protein